LAIQQIPHITNMKGDEKSAALGSFDFYVTRFDCPER